MLNDVVPLILGTLPTHWLMKKHRKMILVLFRYKRDDFLILWFCRIDVPCHIVEMFCLRCTDLSCSECVTFCFSFFLIIKKKKKILTKCEASLLHFALDLFKKINLYKNIIINWICLKKKKKKMLHAFVLACFRVLLVYSNLLSCYVCFVLIRGISYIFSFFFL